MSNREILEIFSGLKVRSVVSINLRPVWLCLDSYWSVVLNEQTLSGISLSPAVLVEAPCHPQFSWWEKLLWVFLHSPSQKWLLRCHPVSHKCGFQEQFARSWEECNQVSCPGTLCETYKKLWDFLPPVTPMLPQSDIRLLIVNTRALTKFFE